MRSSLTRRMLPFIAVVALLVAGEARAQAFANRTLGLGVTGFKLLGDDTELISWGVPLTLEGGYYIESGWDLYLRIPVMLLYQKVGVTAGLGGGLVVATGGQFGVRYLFMEESLRPYVNLHVAGIYIFRDPNVCPECGSLPNFMGGPGVGGGLDYFVADSISMGARVYLDMFITLNKPLRFALGGGINATTYF